MAEDEPALRELAASIEAEHPYYSILLTQAATDCENLRRENMELREVLADLVLEVEGRLFPFGECTMKSRQSAWPIFVHACGLIGKTHFGIFRTPITSGKLGT